MEESYIVKVAPIVSLSVYKTQIFSYIHKVNISAGSLVKIPFGYKYVRGVVISSEISKNYQQKIKLKNIGELIEEAFLNDIQIKLAKLMAEYYICPLGIILKSMIPQKAKLNKVNAEVKRKKPKIIFHDEADSILNDKHRNICLVAPLKKRNNIFLSLVESIKKENAQCLYLVSEILAAWSAFESVRQHYSDDQTAIFWSGMSKGKYYSEWQKVRTGSAKVIISTKIGVFLPFQDLRLIFVNDDQDIAYKQWDMNPRYSAVKVSSFLADLSGAKLIYAGTAITLANYESSKKKQIKIYEMTFDQKPSYSLKIINLYNEKNSHDFPITTDLFKIISKCLNEKKKILLIAKRRGYSSYTVCKRCKEIFRCPKCERALVYFEHSENYRCLHCSFTADILSACPSCGACHFSHQGFGIDLIEKKIGRLFPDAKLEKITRDISKSEHGRKNIMKSIMSCDILLGTQIALKIGAIKQFDLVVFVNLDDMGNISDYNTSETTHALLLQGVDLVKDKGIFAAQTYFTDNDLLLGFSREENNAFYEKELKIRKKLNLPPYSAQILLAFSGKNKAKVDREAQRMFDLLLRLSNNKIEISEPYEPIIAKKRGMIYKKLLIKTNSMGEIKKLPIYPALAALGKGWKIDVDPISSL
jgi:primosomal protein N' (replication factor Y) (superfamily II helicase)